MSFTVNGAISKLIIIDCMQLITLSFTVFEKIILKIWLESKSTAVKREDKNIVFRTKSLFCCGELILKHHDHLLPDRAVQHRVILTRGDPRLTPIDSCWVWVLWGISKKMGVREWRTKK